MEYVVKSERLAKFLYHLGFNYRKVKDKTNNRDYVFLFNNTENLKEAISFWNDFRKQRKNTY